MVARTRNFGDRDLGHWHFLSRDPRALRGRSRLRAWPELDRSQLWLRSELDRSQLRPRSEAKCLQHVVNESGWTCVKRQACSTKLRSDLQCAAKAICRGLAGTIFAGSKHIAQHMRIVQHLGRWRLGSQQDCERRKEHGQEFHRRRRVSRLALLCHAGGSERWKRSRALLSCVLLGWWLLKAKI